MARPSEFRGDALLCNGPVVNYQTALASVKSVAVRIIPISAYSVHPPIPAYRHQVTLPLGLHSLVAPHEPTHDGQGRVH